MIVTYVFSLLINFSFSENTLETVEANISTLKGETDTIWIMLSAFLVMLMQAGFAMLEMGAVRSKNAQNILAKNLLDITMATVIWFLVG